MFFNNNKKEYKEKDPLKENAFNVIIIFLVIMLIAYFIYSAVNLYQGWNDYIELGDSIQQTETGKAVRDAMLDKTFISFIISFILFSLVVIINAIKVHRQCLVLQRNYNQDDQEVKDVIKTALKSMRSEIEENKEKIQELERELYKGEVKK